MLAQAFGTLHCSELLCNAELRGAVSTHMRSGKQISRVVLLNIIHKAQNKESNFFAGSRSTHSAINGETGLDALKCCL